MKKLRNFAIIRTAFLVFASLAVSGCDWFALQAATSASLTVSFGTARDFAPELTLTPARFKLTGIGPDGSTFVLEDITQNSVTLSDLALGWWTITADAYNAIGIIIYSGDGDVELIAGQAAGLEITCRPLEGTGNIAITLVWETGLFHTPSVTGRLVDAAGAETPLTLSCTNSGATLTLPAAVVGYYGLDLELEDLGIIRWTMTEALRVLKDQATPASATITETDLTRLPVARPVIALVSTENFDIPSETSVSLSCSTADAVIRYTLDGNDPTAYNGTVYAAPFTINSNCTVKARAFKSGWKDSLVASSVYTAANTVAAVTFWPTPGLQTGPVEVTMTCPTAGTQTIIYTLDGSDPALEGGTTYSGPIAIAATTLIRAYVRISGSTSSDVASANYVISSPAAAPEADFAPGAYHATFDLNLTTATPGAHIRYTLDGSTPTRTHGSAYLSPVRIDRTLTLTAYAFADGYGDSAPMTGQYVLRPEPPIIDPNILLFTGASLNVNLSCPTPDTVIVYTLDESVPADGNGIYATSCLVTTSVILKAVARSNLPGWTDSDVATAQYYWNEPIYPLDNGAAPVQATLRWAGMADAVSYEVQLESSPASFSVDDIRTTALPEYQVPDPLAFGDWYWRVRKVLADDTRGAWTSAFMFSTIYEIGDTGPASGFIFYDKGEYSDGWRYMEAAPSDQSTSTVWGPSTTWVGGTAYGFGSGPANTSAIVAFYGAGTYAASLCADYELNGFSDWYLPSMDELQYLRNNLYLFGLGNLASEAYWSSSEMSSYDAYYEAFSNGYQNYWPKLTESFHVRAVRRF